MPNCSSGRRSAWRRCCRYCDWNGGRTDGELGFFAAPVNARVRNELKSVETEIKYAGYLDQQRKAIDKLKKAEQRVIPRILSTPGISGLSREMQETLARVRPQTLGQASRIPGVTPAALSLLNVYLEVGEKRKAATAGIATE